VKAIQNGNPMVTVLVCSPLPVGESGVKASARTVQKMQNGNPQVSVFQYVLPLPVGEGGVRASAHTVQKMQNGNPQVTVFSVFSLSPWERAG